MLPPIIWIHQNSIKRFCSSFCFFPRGEEFCNMWVKVLAKFHPFAQTFVTIYTLSIAFKFLTPQKQVEKLFEEIFWIKRCSEEECGFPVGCSIVLITEGSKGCRAWLPEYQCQFALHDIYFSSHTIIYHILDALKSEKYHPNIDQVVPRCDEYLSIQICLNKNCSIKIY